MKINSRDNYYYCLADILLAYSQTDIQPNYGRPVIEPGL